MILMRLFLNIFIWHWVLVGNSFRFYAQTEQNTVVNDLIHSKKSASEHLKTIFEFIEASDNEDAITQLNNHAFLYCDSLLHYGTIEEELLVYKYIAFAWNNAGFINDYAGETKKALQDYFKAYQLSLQFNLYEPLGAASNNIGSTLSQNKSYEESEDFFMSGYAAYKQEKNTSGMALSLNNAGSSLFKKGNYDQAAELHKKSFELRKMLNDKHGMAWSLNNLASVKNKAGLFQIALDYNLEALKIQQENTDIRGILYSYQSLALCYYDLKEFNTAESYANKALEHALKNDIKMEIDICKKVISEIINRTRNRDSLILTPAGLPNEVIKIEMYKQAAKFYVDSLVNKVKTYKSSNELSYNYKFIGGIFVSIAAGFIALLLLMRRKTKTTKI
jgi:tetratricopeptide (TPR) repeat protein